MEWRRLWCSRGVTKGLENCGGASRLVQGSTESQGCDRSLSYPWHPNGPRHTLVMSSGSPDSPKQSPTTPDPSPDLSDLCICIPKSPAMSPDPCMLSPISIQSNRPFPTPTTSPKPVQHFSVMLTLSNLIFCHIGPRPLPNASGNFPVPSLMLLNQYLAWTTSLKPYRPSWPMLTSPNPYRSHKLPWHPWLSLLCVLGLW